MIRTQVQFTDAQMRKLKRLAAERGVSLAALIREGVDLLVRGTPEDGETGRRQRALAAAGRFHSDRTDLAIEHDRYLGDAFSR
jgi:hypothetical protein